MNENNSNSNVVTDKKDFHVKVKLNGVVKEFTTNDIEETLMSMKPNFIKTRMIVTITRNEDDAVCQKLVFPQRSRMMFRTPSYMQLFIKSLAFKPYGQG